MHNPRIESGDIGVVFRNNRIVAMVYYMPSTDHMPLGYYRVNIKGYLDIERDQTDYGMMSDAILKCVDRDVPLVINLRGVKNCDSSAVSSLIRIARGRNERKVSIIGAPDKLRDLFEVHNVPVALFYKNLRRFLLEEEIPEEDERVA